MRHVERHIIKQSHSLWQQIDDLCFLSKNLYNHANYLIRQSFIFDQVYLGFNRIYHQVKNTVDYQALPRKVSQQVLRILDRNWKSFFEAQKTYQKYPDKFRGRPKLPKYKHKTQGRNLVVYTIQAISRPWLKRGMVKLSGTEIIIPTKAKNIAQVRIIPRIGQYVIEIIYEQNQHYTVINPHAIAAIDLGVDNLAALTSNQTGFIPILINGRPLKSLNQFYNKIKARLQSLLPGKKPTSKGIQRLTAKRNNRVDTYLHQASRGIIDLLDSKGIGKLIIGQNPLWKQKVNTGKQNNQSFVSIPHARFVEMLIYKGQIKGIEVVCTEESYTSKASFLNLDPIPVYGGNEAQAVKFSGYRQSRGIYKIKGENTRINADVNGSYNIMRKAIKCCLGGFPHEQLHQEVIPTVFDRGIGGAVVRPIRITPGQAKSSQCHI